MIISMRKLLVVAALFLISLPAFAVESKSVVDDVIKMSKAGVAEETILDFVKKADRYDVTADDVIAMSEANVPRGVIRAVVDEAETSSPGARDRGRDHVERETVVVAPYYGWGYPGWGYSYDPFSYRPSVYLGFGFGGYFGHGYHHGGGGFHHHHR